MTTNAKLIETEKLPSRTEAVLFRAKTMLHQTRRAVKDLSRPVKRFSTAGEPADALVIARSVTKLWTEADPREQLLLAGKIHNLRIAARRLNGVEIPPGEIFSFWKHVGRTTRRRGYAPGRELREGCVIPNIGGGLCQLSNALYDAALQANCTVIERHAHTRVIAGSLAETGRDATVFWNYVDLRFMPLAATRIEIKIDANELTVIFRSTAEPSAAGMPPLHQIAQRSTRRAKDHSPNSCATCEQGDCFRVVKAAPIETGRTAFLVDEFVPEFDSYIRSVVQPRDILLLPIDGKRFRKANYRWTTAGFAAVKQNVWTTAVRSYRSRKLAKQGAERQRNLLRMSRRMAARHAAKLDHTILHTVVQENLLPHLWLSGELGGRTFDVLMNTLPMAEIQKQLDRAFAKHPESGTLGDFRADPRLVAAEAEALRSARKIITPHSYIAEIFAEKAVKVEWHLPNVERRCETSNKKPMIAFPAATVGRKGCYEFREAVRGMNVKLLLFGPLIESANFWEGFDVELSAGNDRLLQANAVVLPAYVEHRPRRLLTAAAAGIPVIATAECGVKGVKGIEIVDLGDIPALRRAIESAVSKDFPGAKSN